MEGSKKMLVGLLLVIAVALPAAMAYSSSFEKDFIIPETVEAVLKRKAALSNMMMEDEDAVLKIISTTKTIISNPVLEEAFLNNLNGANGIPCGESFVWIPCFSSAFGCSCKSKVCYRNSLLDHKY